MSVNRLFLSVLVLIGLLLPMGDAQAQSRPPVCNDLEAALLTLSRPNRGISTQNQRLQSAIRKQAGVIGQTQADAQRAGCDQPSGFILFRAPRPTVCRQYDAALAKMQRTLQQMQSQLGRQGDERDQDRERGQILTQLALNGCGQQYARFLPNGGRQTGRGFLSSIFGSYRDPYVSAQDAPRMGAYRTVCVRKCDGFFFPVSFSTFPGNFESDRSLCQSSCPGIEVELFSYANPGGKIEEATSPEGMPYSNLENAFRYRTEFVEGCRCERPKLQLASGNGNAGRIVATLFPEGFDASQIREKVIPLPTPKPAVYDIGLFENPFAGEEPAVAVASSAGSPIRRTVRVVGPKFVYARSAKEADAAQDRNQDQ